VSLKVIAASLTLLLAPSAIASSPDTKTPPARLGVCETPDVIASATITKIGDAEVTATHWAGDPACYGKVPHVRISKTDDVTILRGGKHPPCVNARLGEPLVFLGFPGTDPWGNQLQVGQMRLEADAGRLSGHNKTAWLRNDLGQPLVLRHEDTALAHLVRPGYSGGPALSALDGRVVGIIHAVQPVVGGLRVTITPIERICAMIDELTPQ
jgi:hypothetical protein